MSEIIRKVQLSTGRDISCYDESFLAASLEKRLALCGMKTGEEYGRFLSENGAEAEALFRSLAINYSEFFRNPLTFALLEQFLLPTLADEQQKPGRTEIRIWSAGCAAGQEPYSVAMLLDEYSAAHENAVSYRIFATDSSESEIVSARKGEYDFAAVQNVKLRHIAGYFVRRGETYAVVSRLKERMDFSAYDLLDERSQCPTASIYGDFDLVLCCNLLFYYKPDIRYFILSKIHRSLAPNGYLVTGEAEKEIVGAYGGFRTLLPFAAVFKKTKQEGDA